MITRQDFIKLAAIVARAKLLAERGNPYTVDDWVWAFDRHLFIANVNFSKEKFNLQVEEFYNEFKSRTATEDKAKG